MTDQSRRRRRPVSGWVVLDKPYDMTSTQAVAKVRWLFEAEKAGHAGTLDPLATGILPIALGQATKTVPVVQDGTKGYEFTIKWGEATSTDDAEGEVVERSAHRPQESDINAMLGRFVGPITQVPPAFSAIRIAGERAYDLARAGRAPEMAPREVVVHALVLLEAGADFARLEARCEKGTYVRALARDLAAALGTCGHVAALRRTAVGPFNETRAVSIAAIEALDLAGRDACLLSVAAGLADIPEIRLAPEDAQSVRHGNAVLLRGSAAPVAVGLAWASAAGQALALGSVAAGQFKPHRVIG